MTPEAGKQSFNRCILNINKKPTFQVAWILFQTALFKANSGGKIHDLTSQCTDMNTL